MSHLSNVTCCASNVLNALLNPARSTDGHTALTAAGSRSLYPAANRDNATRIAAASLTTGCGAGVVVLSTPAGAADAARSTGAGATGGGGATGLDATVDSGSAASGVGRGDSGTTTGGAGAAGSSGAGAVA